MLNRTQWILFVACAIALWLILGSIVREEKPPRQAFRQRLVAVGDLHGDIRNTKAVLRMAKLIDEHDKWVGGTDILVQTGDNIDRGTYALDIYRLMAQLRDPIRDAGGQLYTILGNHEYMDAIGDWRYVSKADIAHWGGPKQRLHDLSLDGWLGQEWLANYTTTQRVHLAPFKGAPSLSFTHGSLRPSYPHLLPYPDRINELGASLLKRGLTPPMAPPHPPNPYRGLPEGTTPAEASVYDGEGPLWWRGLADVPDEKTVCAWAAELQEKLGVRRIIGGHTPDFERIVDRCGGDVIIIDTGISYAYGGVLSALEIIYTLTPVDGVGELSADGAHIFREGDRYVEREEVYAVYQRGKKKIAVVEQQITI
ncbi:Metallo-dependent phosphatase [Cutaneotrichosporon oleaginosum]|uniref:Metallo-dependent phosphatase n=1 Tax=Cutaneotrichosporon oleaginosum TaxID=879819 RepID=A0A0J1B0C7_9TREE|nr:Metallo-dependent phosphatase [Cutaneotrichosporon oleaginosum]KLT41049.1 Metallo-dependent phosphatase [Cutaneotrichosporon oleaginosum]TXT12141.1 hypothetical protein COLE_02551 [Cutaneotrichosporon oleaginosum]